MAGRKEMVPRSGRAILNSGARPRSEPKLSRLYRVRLSGCKGDLPDDTCEDLRHDPFPPPQTPQTPRRQRDPAGANVGRDGPGTQCGAVSAAAQLPLAYALACGGGGGLV